MQHAKLEEKLNDISTLLVMLEPEDSTGFEGLMAALEELAVLASEAPELGKLATATTQIIEARASLPTLEFCDILNSFLSKSQAYLRDPNSETVLLILEDGKVLAPATPKDELDILDSADPEFLVEFIEKHASMMEDFESAILELRYKTSQLAPDELKVAQEEFLPFTKGYIHTLKGDSGSIGLMALERTCHKIEDLLLEQPPYTALDALLLFKEWVSSGLKALAAGSSFPEKASSFFKRFSAAILQGEHEEPGETPSAKDDNAEKSAASPSADAPYINLDLLAELMNDSSSTLSNSPKDAVQETSYNISGDAELFVEFIVEAEDHLSSVESTILDSGGNYDKESIDLIFRGIHSIKGASSYFNLKEVAETSHLTENLLDEVRSGLRTFDQELTALVLAYVDLQKRLMDGAREAMKADGTIVRQAASENYLSDLKNYQIGEGVSTERDESPAPKASAPLSPVQKRSEVITADDGEESGNTKGKADKLEVKSFVKVDTQRLDQLIDAIGEMCIYSSMLIQNTRQLFAGNEKLIKTTHQVEKFSRDLQNIGMSMRLIPIRALFQKMSRLVWDTAKKINKEVKFDMEGEDTELDRTIIEKLADPLMHMVRNAIDHGVELPDDRAANGKPRAGHVSLSAYHAGGSIHIRLKDDGRGLDPDKLVKKAIEKGILTEGQKLSKEEAFNLIFAPGFSTAAAVTDISGRGVGMDVVRRNIESMRGRVHIESELGKGSTFTIELPLTLAIIDGIEVTVGRETFIIPTLSVVEFMRPSPSMITRTLDKGETFQFRGKYLPVYRLGDLFRLEHRNNNPTDSILVVVESSGEQAAIMVDDIIGSYSTVIKSLGEMFAAIQGVAGCAIVSNGDISLILDVRSLLSAARKNYTFERKAPQALEAPAEKNLQA